MLLPTHTLDASNVRDHVRAGQAWFLDADIPDPLHRMDLYGEPDLVAEVLSRRSHSSTLVGIPHVFEGPKPTGGERRFTYLDPYADLALRMAARSAAVCVEASTPEQVLHTRVEFEGRRKTWRTVAWRDSHKQQRQRTKELRHGLGAKGGVVLTLDVRNFYPSVDLDLLAIALRSCRLADYQFSPLLGLVREINQFASVGRGLPIGPETSALLATAALLPADRALRGARIAEYTRWSDDFQLFLPSSRVCEAIEVLTNQLSLLGLKLNVDKTKPEDVESLEATSVNLSMTEPDAAEPRAPENVDPLSDLISAVEKEDSKRASFVIGGFRRRRDVRAIPIVAKYPWTTRVLPKQFAAYLTDVGNDLADGDREWIADRALSKVGSSAALEQVRLGYVLARVAALPADGARLFDDSVKADRRTQAPVADAFACAAANSREKFGTRAKRASEYAVEFADLNAKRAHMSVLRTGVIGDNSKRALNALVKRDPDMAPTAAWILSCSR